MASPGRARSLSQPDISPCGTLRTTNDTSFSAGPELNEYARVWSLPGTWTFTYCPGWKLSAWRSSRAMEKVKVVGDSARLAVICPWKVPTSAASAAAAISTTQSLTGRIWQVSTLPAPASSAESASST